MLQASHLGGPYSKGADSEFPMIWRQTSFWTSKAIYLYVLWTAHKVSSTRNFDKQPTTWVSTMHQSTLTYTHHIPYSDDKTLEAPKVIHIRSLNIIKPLPQTFPKTHCSIKFEALPYNQCNEYKWGPNATLPLRPQISRYEHIILVDSEYALLIYTPFSLSIGRNSLYNVPQPENIS